MTEVKSQKDILARFLADNMELEQLSACLRTFNVFSALGVEDYEIRHSMILAWLLDPNGSHGLGPIFLRRLLSSLLLDNQENESGLSAVDVELMDFEDVEVRREWRHIDIAIFNHDPKDKFVIIIENKVHSKEHGDQLSRYHNKVHDLFKGYRILCVYLTLDGDEVRQPDDKQKYILWSYRNIYDVIDRIVKQSRQQMTAPVSTFFDHYLTVIRRLVMRNDDEIVNLSKEIYRKHRAAIDLIVQYGREFDSVFHNTLEKTLNELGGYSILCKQDCDFFWFLPKKLADILPENSDEVWRHLEKKVSVCCWFLKEKNKESPGSDWVSLVFECCKMNDSGQRLRFINLLSKQSEFKLGKRAFRLEAKFSRFFLRTVEDVDLEDEESVKAAVIKLLDDNKAAFDKLDEVCRGFFK